MPDVTGFFFNVVAAYYNLFCVGRSELLRKKANVAAGQREWVSEWLIDRTTYIYLGYYVILLDQVLAC